MHLKVESLRLSLIFGGFSGSKEVIMWLFHLSLFCFWAHFSPAPVSTGPIAGMGGWESKEQPDRRYEEIGPRMRGHGPKATAAPLPPYRLPMFRQVKAPLVDMELFRPTAGQRPLPSAVKHLLLPQFGKWDPTTPVTNPRGIEVWCGNGTLSVRVNRRILGFWCQPSMLFLGNCEVYRFTRDYIYFHNYLDDCGITQNIVDGQLVYTGVLRYVPEPQIPGAVIRAVPLSLSIHCSYNRFHYTYKVGYIPNVKKGSFYKSINSERIFSLVACNERWERLGSTESFVLGGHMNFEASAPIVSRTERVSVTACHVTASKDPHSMPQMNVIENYGCMVDSKRIGSRSKFHSYRSGVLRFSIDAFKFPGISSKHLYLHCEITAADYVATSTAKSCTFNSKLHRWEELIDSSSVCSCCDSHCAGDGIGLSSLHPPPRSLITSDPWSVLSAVTPRAGAGAGQAEVPEVTLEGEDAEKAGPKEESKDSVQVRKSQGRGKVQESLQIKRSKGRPLRAQEGEPAEWREDDRGPDLDEEVEVEDEGLQEKVRDADGDPSPSVAGRVLESLVI
ncbi:hypothetical protein GJAV_G00004590 [Gymnothorax javanicus]|nr:hypothetical protein GJAV_G00004590 [Gymnothorax javanicus]